MIFERHDQRFAGGADRHARDERQEESHFSLKAERSSDVAARRSAEAESPDADAADSPALEDAARAEEEYLRRRLRDELKREPTEQELNEWLRQHTEGY